MPALSSCAHSFFHSYPLLSFSFPNFSLWVPWVSDRIWATWYIGQNFIVEAPSRPFPHSIGPLLLRSSFISDPSDCLLLDISPTKPNPRWTLRGGTYGLMILYKRCWEDVLPFDLALIQNYKLSVLKLCKKVLRYITFPNFKGAVIGRAFDLLLKQVAQTVQRYSFEFFH